MLFNPNNVRKRTAWSRDPMLCERHARVEVRCFIFPCMHVSLCVFILLFCFCCLVNENSGSRALHTHTFWLRLSHINAKQRNTALIIGVCLPLASTNHCYFTYILFIIYFRAPEAQYLDYIDNGGVKGFVLLAIALLLFGFTFRCSV